MDKQFPLKWRNHVSSLLQNIQLKAPYTDASLACEGRVYQVHRVILSSCSEYFRDLFKLKQTAAENTFIILADIESKNLEYLIHYMYKGEVNVTEYEIAPLLDAAEYLKIKGLTLAVRGRQEAQLFAQSSLGLSKSNIAEQLFSPPWKKKKADVLATPMSNKSYENTLTPTTTPKNTNFSIESISESFKDYSEPNAPHHLAAAEVSGNFYTNTMKDALMENANTNFASGFWPTGYTLPNEDIRIQQPLSQETKEKKNYIGNNLNQTSDILTSENKDNVGKVGQTPPQNVESSLIEELGSDNSEAYSSDDDPIMVSRIQKICKRTHRNLIAKLKRQNPTLDLSGSSVTGTIVGQKRISISTVNKGDGRTMATRINYCYFCNSPQTQIWRHIKTIHKAETHVAKLGEITDEADLKQEIDLLRNLGNFHHNKEVLQAGNGELKVYRRTDNARLSYKSFSPCPKCLLFLSKNDLWRHCRYRCMTQTLGLDGRGNTASFRHLLFMSNAVLSLHLYFKKNEKKILAQVKDSDDISSIAAKDEIILHLGNYLFENLRGDRPHVIRQSMRLAARILLQVRLRTNQHYLTMFQVLRPPYFDFVTEAVTLISHYLRSEEPNSELASLAPPKVALQLGILLRKCLAVKVGIALRTHSEDDRKDAKAFDSAMDKLAADMQPSAYNEEKTLSDFLEVEMEGDIDFDSEDEDGDLSFKEEPTWEGPRSVVGEILEAEAREAGMTVTPPPNSRSAAALRRIPYSPAENEAILKYFGDQIDKKQMIRKEDIEKLFSNPFYEGELNSRSWKNIKYKVHNLIQKKNK